MTAPQDAADAARDGAAARGPARLDVAGDVAGDARADGSLTRRLARRLRRPAAAADRARAALHVLDWAGCAVAGAASPAGRAAAAFASQMGGGPCAGLGLGRRLSEAGAAFFNGALGNVLEMDDIHRTSILHPGPVAVPAALAAAEARGLGAEAFLDAVVRGYEAAIRVGASVGPGHYALWHNTGTCGPFGAAAAAGSAAGLDEDALVWALGNAGSQASGPWRMRHEPVMSKQLHTARAAEAGLAAAGHAEAGFTGPEWILEGEQGFYAAMAPDPRPEAVDEGPADAPWRLWDVSFKPWPACRHAHPAIDAALDLRARGVRSEEVASLAIETYGDAVRFCDRPDPRSEIEAKFSLQHAVAVALSGGPPPLGAFRGAALAAAAPLRARASVVRAPRFDAAYPARYGAAVEARLTSGAALRAEAPDALGDPDNPISQDALIAKARALIEDGGRSPAQADRLIEAALALPKGGALRAFAAALAEAPAP